ncbi:hypothetical protein [Nodosilinea sp. LEGE 06152]|uniref:hypothetical protein n=1 Tax=Nodosilinea sp. LEGE 06152 TaxID=2777966 RepID=UPI001D15D866|nr:hypothetical protein [Nodosilinea sp. LEGE 06152]
MAQSVLSNLPPSVDNAPPELQTELLGMQGLSVEELHAIAQALTEPAQRDRRIELLQKNEAGQLTQAEREELFTLRQLADHLMLRKAYA